MFVSWILSITVASCVLCTSHHRQCGEKEYEHLDICCPMCKPGQRVNGHCTSTSGTECHQCADKTYQDRFNGDDDCKTCRSCAEGTFPVKPCTVKYNTVCDCLEGFHCDNITVDGCEKCTKHSACPPGEEVVSKGAYRKDTECRRQETGSISPEEGTGECVPGQTGDISGCVSDIYVIVLSVLLCVLVGILLFLHWKSLTTPFCSAIAWCLEKTKEKEAVIQRPVQEEGHQTFLRVSLEEKSMDSFSTHTKPIHDFAPVKMKDVGTSESQYSDFGVAISTNSSVEKFQDAKDLQ
ncbi:tumor necrosis factor receptor superfamily member 14-like isoform X2 [Chiloscyllium plagiosum]|uniref:tumor necrosis factor receptor superfamily member 14-like isoform X2 n=1 Tax=Chiloscyllium plagiosum TaxID=36176 RepID=UPI001CB84D69|nr:tumor necrosis factor receptor superfamily member 14-like isoform X2 [Chiloscyllium plagiosum]